MRIHAALALVILLGVSIRPAAAADAPAPATAASVLAALRASMLASDSILVMRVELEERATTDSAGQPHTRLITHRVAIRQMKAPWMKRFVANFLPEGTELRPEVCPPPRESAGLAKPWMLSALWIDKDGRGQAYVSPLTGCGFAGLAGGGPAALDLGSRVDSLMALFREALPADTALARVSVHLPADTTHRHVAVETVPEAITRVPPVYPDSARAAGIEGTVLVKVLIGKDGLVQSAEIQSSVPGLDGPALAAVKQWRFKPATSDGTPHAVWVSIPVNFHLSPAAPAAKH